MKMTRIKGKIRAEYKDIFEDVDSKISKKITNLHNVETYFSKQSQEVFVDASSGKQVVIRRAKKWR